MSFFHKTKIDDILHVEFGDLKTQNAFSPAAASEFHKLISSESFTALYFSSIGSVFCSGGNLSYYKSLTTREEGLRANKEINNILAEFDSLRVPKVCFVNGSCFGGGIELLSCFDHVVASPAALFGLWQRRIGLSFGWGGAERLRRRLSKHQLSEWLLHANTITSYHAKEIGLVDSIKLESQGKASCIQWLKQTLSYGPQSLELLAKKKLDYEEAFQALWHGERHLQALERFR